MITLPITCRQLLYILMILPPIGVVVGFWINSVVVLGLSLGFLIGDIVVLLVLGINDGWTFPIRCKCDKK